MAIWIIYTIELGITILGALILFYVVMFTTNLDYTPKQEIVRFLVIMGLYFLLIPFFIPGIIVFIEWILIDPYIRISGVLLSLGASIYFGVDLCSRIKKEIIKRFPSKEENK